MAKSSRYEALMERARAGAPILIDGGTGSECIRRGVPETAMGWSGGAALSHPEIVRAIHDDYLDLGADLIASSTFATGANILRDVGAADAFETLNRRAVELAVEARDDRDGAADGTVVAGGISNWSFSGDHPPLEHLAADTRAQALVMREAGADLISLEMMVDLPRFATTLEAAATVGLPLWVGFSIGDEQGHDPSELGEEIELRDGGSLAEAVAVAAGHEAVDAICIMHTDVHLVERCLAAVRSVWDGPLGAYGHAGVFIDGVFTHGGITPSEYAAFLPAWQSAGATMLGGCCGIGPSHLQLVAEHLGREAA